VDNIITENKYGILDDNHTFLNNTINGNTITNNSNYGIYSSAGGITIISNTIANNGGASGGGIRVWHGEEIRFNLIYGNMPYGVNNEGAITIYATNNWWGANDGPSTSPGSGDKVSANVDYDPWLVINISASPTSITRGSTSTITADMTRNSKGQDTSADGHIPDGTKIIFTTNLGSIGSTTVTKETVDGKATATLTAGNTAGTATVCVQSPHGDEVPVAQYRVCTTVNITAPTGVTTPPRPRASPSPPSPPQLPPADMHVHSISVSPGQAQAGQPVTVLANVVNNGASAGSYNVVLRINSRVEQQRTIEVSPGAAYPVKFTVTKSQPGTYDVAIDGQQNSFTIIAAGRSTGSHQNGGLIAILIVSILIIIVSALLILDFRRRA